MMKRIFAILLVVLMLTFCVIGCSEKTSEEPRTPCEELITQKYGISELYESVTHYFSSNAHSGYVIPFKRLGEKLKVECVRDDLDNPYAVFDVSEGGRVFVFYTPQGAIDRSVWVKEPLEWKAFKNLDEGDTMADVAEIDPVIAMYSGETPYNVHWVYAGKNQNGVILYNAVSFHLLGDRLVAIQYEAVDGEVERDKLTKEQFIIEKIETYEDYNYKIDNGTLYNGEYNFTILDQDYVK